MECCPCLGGGDDDPNKRAGQYAAGGIPCQAIMGGHRACGEPVDQVGDKLEKEEPTYAEEKEEPTAEQLRLVQNAHELVQADNWLSLADMADELLRTAQDLRSAKREWADAIFGWLGVCYKELGQYDKAIELQEQCLSLAEEVGDRAAQGMAGGNLGNCYLRLGQYTKAIEHLEQ